MNTYPFNELDYLVREENGFRLATAYLQNPTESNLEAFRAGVQRDIRPMISEGFWGIVGEIALVEDDLFVKVQQTFDYCFSLAFWDMKEQWYRALGENKTTLKRQWDHSLAISTQIIYERLELNSFVDQYEAALEKFTSRLTTNLLGYVFIEPEEQQIVLPVNNDVITPVQRAETSIFRKANLRDRPYERVLDKLFQELGNQRLIVQSESLRADFRGIFIGPFRQKVDWTGDIQLLTYLIRKLSGSGVVDLGVISRREIWKTTANCFTVRGESCVPRQLKDTHTPRGRNIVIMNQLIDELREIIAA